MPLVIEDGTGKANGDSWVTEEDATAFFTDRGIASWIAATVERREQALRMAADYLLMVYRWPGQPSFATQRLPWPRTGVRSGRGWYPATDIPSQVVDAQLQLALESLDRNILQKLEPASILTEKSEEVKGIKRSMKFATSPLDPISGIERIPLVDQILRGIALGALGGDFAIVPLRR